MRDRVLWAVSAAASAVYLVTQNWQPFPASALLKTIPVGLLALIALRRRGLRRDAGLLALGLAFSAAGDLLLDLDPRYFVFGLIAFLLTHLTYICLFLRNRTGGARLTLLIPIVAYSAALSIWIVPSVGEMAVPVVFYVCALTTMACTAILAGFPKPWVAIGAVLFLISDSLLAINKFKTPVPMHGYLIWITYYLGQSGITWGYLESGP